MIGGRMASIKVGEVGNGRKVGLPIGRPTIEQAAGLLNIGERSVARAKKVLDAGSKEIIEAVDSGTLPVAFAAKVVIEEPDKKTQTHLFKKGGKAALKEHITEPSPFVDDAQEKSECAVNSLKKLWKKWDATQRTAVRVWIDEHYMDIK